MADSRIDRSIRQSGSSLRGVDRHRQQRADSHGPARARVQPAELAVVAEPAVGNVDLVENLAHRGGRGDELTSIGGENVHRGAQRLPALDREGHHEPPLVTVPLPLLPVVGTCGACCRLLLLSVELELESVDVVVDVVVFAAVADAVADDLPAYEAAAT